MQYTHPKIRSKLHPIHLIELSKNSLHGALQHTQLKFFELTTLTSLTLYSTSGKSEKK
tara:strand:- start:11228 stop:11401 length:174 start_codon:yes stop_codon:yes gene_type:complete